MLIGLTTDNILLNEHIIIGSVPNLEEGENINYKYSLVTFNGEKDVPLLYGLVQTYNSEKVIKVSYEDNGSKVDLEAPIIKSTDKSFWYYLLDKPLSGTEESSIKVTIDH